MMKTALAPTAELGTKKVERFVRNKILPVCGNDANLDEFYLCDPSTSNVSNYHGERWLEGNWGAKIKCYSVSVGDLIELCRNNGTIQIGDTVMRATCDSKLEVSIWLTARVMR